MSMHGRFRTLSIVTAMGVGVVVQWPSGARACLNGVIHDTQQAAQLLAQAERAVAGGHPRRALAHLEGGPTVSCRDPLSIKSCRIASGDDVLVDDRLMARRWALLTAVARLRAHRGNAETLARHLLYLKQLYGDAPFIQARLAEALSRVVGTKPNALALLTDLEQRDVMPDAEGYALLARLRRLRGDLPGYERAMIRCQQMNRAPAACPAT